MIRFLQRSSKGLATVIVALLFFSCQNRINQVRKLGSDDFSPQTIEKGVDLVYTDSGRVAAILHSPKLLDYTNLNFPIRKFPKGVSVKFFDDNDEANTVVADSALVYDQTGLVDLRGHVKIVTGDSIVLKAQQLYWNRKQKWLFTDEPYTIRLADGTVNKGAGFDADEKFNNFISRSNTGIHYIDENSQ